MATAVATPDMVAEPAKSKKKLIIILAVVALVAAAAAYVLVLKPSGGPPPPPEAGAVIKMDAIQVNLAGGHYLKIGIALQLTKKAGEEVDGSKALDATIGLFSGKSVSEVTTPKDRQKLQKELGKELKERYEGEVMGVYFTDFVTQ